MAMKPCNKCGEVKPLSEFHKHNQLKDGHRNTCKVCRVAELNNDPRHKIRQKEWYQKNKIKRRNSLLLNAYGIDSEGYDSLFKQQNGVCAICGLPPTRNYLSVDHCHTTGRVRGLLCNPCNQAIGLLKDDRDRLQAAINYLEEK